MRKLIAAAFVSLDGVMQAPGGPSEDPTKGFTQGGWTVDYSDDAVGKFVMDEFAQPYDLLLGRKTYEIFAAHWPYMGDDPIAVSFNAATKYVATASVSQPLAWANSVRLTGDVAAEIGRLKQADGPNLLTQGSSVLLQTLLEHDLIDEFRLLTYPVLLGAGKRFFDGGAKPAGLKLERTTTSGTGVVMSVYRPAGAIKLGSFEMPPPNAAEAARQERMKREG